MTNREIRQVQCELLAWLEHQPRAVSGIGGVVAIGLDNAMRFGTTPATLWLLAGDVERLASAASDEDKSGH